MACVLWRPNMSFMCVRKLLSTIASSEGIFRHGFVVCETTLWLLSESMRMKKRGLFALHFPHQYIGI